MARSALGSHTDASKDGIVRHSGALCYFDDHIKNCLRLRQAHTQGFRSLLPGESVEWVWKDRHQRYTYREEHSHGVQEILGKVVQLPNLSGFTGRAAGTQTYVHPKE